MASISSLDSSLSSSRVSSLSRQGFDAQPVEQPKEPQRLALFSKDTFQASSSRQAGLDAINDVKLKSGIAHRCVETTRANLVRAGMGDGLPSGTDADPNNPRGMMVQMLQSGKWDSMNIPGSESQTITSPYGSVKANVLSGAAYQEAIKNGQVPEGSVVFQTRHADGFDYSGGSRGSDVGIVRNGKIFNYAQMPKMTVYGNTDSVVVVAPH